MQVDNENKPGFCFVNYIEHFQNLYLITLRNVPYIFKAVRFHNAIIIRNPVDLMF